MRHVSGQLGDKKFSNNFNVKKMWVFENDFILLTILFDQKIN